MVSWPFWAFLISTRRQFTFISSGNQIYVGSKQKSSKFDNLTSSSWIYELRIINQRLMLFRELAFCPAADVSATTIPLNPMLSCWWKSAYESTKSNKSCVCRFLTTPRYSHKRIWGGFVWMWWTTVLSLTLTYDRDRQFLCPINIFQAQFGCYDDHEW